MVDGDRDGMNATTSLTITASSVPIESPEFVIHRGQAGNVRWPRRLAQGHLLSTRAATLEGKVTFKQYLKSCSVIIRRG